MPNYIFTKIVGDPANGIAMMYHAGEVSQFVEGPILSSETDQVHDAYVAPEAYVNRGIWQEHLPGWSPIPVKYRNLCAHCREELAWQADGDEPWLAVWMQDKRNVLRIHRACFKGSDFEQYALAGPLPENFLFAVPQDEEPVT